MYERVTFIMRKKEYATIDYSFFPSFNIINDRVSYKINNLIYEIVNNI